MQFDNMSKNLAEQMSLETLPRFIALAGPTASGKTAAALAIAKHLHEKISVEIISVDSALVYKGMDIGTAKPSKAELAAVPHHLIDIRDPPLPYSAAEFVKDGTRLVLEITARGHLPVFVGGTMLYFKALFDGLDDMPAANSEVRAELDLEAASIGWPAMHQKLAAIDPTTAARLQPNDAQRIHRAMEVFKISGKPISSFQSKIKMPDFAINNIAAQAINTPGNGQFDPSKILFISLEPTDRAWLHDRIAKRFDAMLADGFEAEVRQLRKRGDLDLNTPSIRCVGYRQMWEALGAKYDEELDKKSASELREKSIAATRQLCKRQLTWLRSMPNRQIIACDTPDAVAKVIGLVDTWIDY
jgi:tRNA dimethylallyltransferase